MKLKFKRILCWFGIHKMKYYGEIAFGFKGQHYADFHCARCGCIWEH